MKNRRATYGFVIHLGHDQSVMIARVVPSRTKRLLGILRRLKYAAVILHRNLVLMTIHV